MIGEILLFDYSSTTTEPPTSAQLRFDSTVLADVTKAWIRNLTTDGIDVHELLAALTAGTVLYVQDKNDHTLYVRCTITGAAVDKETYFELPIIASGVAGVLMNNQALAVLVLEPKVAGPPMPEAAPSPLVTVALAKGHLFRPDLADDDPDLLQKMAAAEAMILRYVQKDAYGREQSATWLDPATTPPDAQHAILVQLDELYRYRGSDLENEGPARDAGSELSPTVTALLRRWTSPVIA